MKKNFLHGLEIPDFNTLNPAIRVWLDTVANVRTHGETHQRPVDRFEEEKAGLHSLPAGPFDCATVHAVRASSRFRVTYDTNRYSVPAEYASTALSRNLSSSLRAELAATPFEARTRASRLLITKMSKSLPWQLYGQVSVFRRRLSIERVAGGADDDVPSGSGIGLLVAEAQVFK